MDEHRQTRCVAAAAVRVSHGSFLLFRPDTFYSGFFYLKKRRSQTCNDLVNLLCHFPPPPALRVTRKPLRIAGARSRGTKESLPLFLSLEAWKSFLLFFWTRHHLMLKLNYKSLSCGHKEETAAGYSGALFPISLPIKSRGVRKIN